MSNKSTSWWIDPLGRNNLAGVSTDPTNLPVLPDHVIVELMLTIPEARADFVRLLPNMLPEEQERLNGIVALNPRVLLDNLIDDQVQGDQIMAKFNTATIRDPNRRGGGYGG